MNATDTARRRHLLGGILLPVVAALAVALPVQAKPAASTVTSSLKVRHIGPAVAGGRVTDVTGIPGNPKVYYVGAAGGGLWKSTDGGESWKQLLPDADSASIGAVAVAPSNHQDVWAGTGEPNVRNDTLTGGGVYFSPDGGKSWKFMGLKKAGQIANIVVDPANPDVVLVAALGNPWKPNRERGVFRTDDGGKTWHKVLYVNDKTGASDVIMDPRNPNVLFAGMWSVRRYPWDLVNGSKTGGVWKSTDNGKTWKKLSDGLPGGETGRITLAAAPSNPDHVYALIVTRHGMLWSSRDQGSHWHKVSNNHALATRGWYFAGMAVSPTDQDKVYFTSLHLMESDDGGKTAHAIDPRVHPDHHTVWVDPDNPKRIIQGNDGGVFLSLNGGKHWRFLDTLPIEQAYTVSVDGQQPFHACIGLQDNSAWCGPTSSLDQGGVTGKNWVPVVGGDGEYSVIAPSNPNIVYSDFEDGYTVRYNLATHVSRQIRPSTSFGLQNTEKSLAESKYRFNWTSPLAVSPTDANTVYIGANVLFKSTDGGKQWSVVSPDLTRNDKSKQQVPGHPIFHDITSAEDYDTILSITLAPTAPNKVIWTGSDDGLVHVTRNGGKHWSNVTPGGAPKWARIYQIGVSPFDAGTAYVAVDAHMLGNDRAYMYRTRDYGHHWSRITRGLPKHTPVLVVREDPHHKGLLVAGTMTGLYYSLDDGNHWHPLHDGLPTNAVVDVKFTPNEHALAVATHGRGLYVFDNLRPLEGWSHKVADSDFHLFAPKPGIIYRHWMAGGQQMPGRTAPNATAGVVFNYYLKNTVKGGTGHQGPVKIVISRHGHSIRTIHGSGKAGMNRAVWRMDYAGATPLGSHHRGGGPDVMPGRYKATVTAGPHQATASVAVSLDPNVDVNTADYKAKLRLALRFTHMMSATNAMLNQLDAWSKQLKAVKSTIKNASDPDTDKAVASQADALQKKVKKLKDALLQPDVQHNVGEDFLHTLPRLHGELMWNSFLLGGYAQHPSRALEDKTAQLRETLTGYIKRFNDLRTGNVKTFNQAAFKAGVGTLATGHSVALKTVTLP